jgi:hypothetical protein
LTAALERAGTFPARHCSSSCVTAEGREPNRRALIELFAKAKAAGVVGPADPELMAGQFFSLLGDMITRLLLGVVETPGAREISRRVEMATTALLVLHAA